MTYQESIAKVQEVIGWLARFGVDGTTTDHDLAIGYSLELERVVEQLKETEKELEELSDEHAESIRAWRRSGY